MLAFKEALIVITQSVMATVAVVLKTKQKLSNDEYAVTLRVTHERQSRFYAFSMLVTNQTFKWRCAAKDWKQAEAEDNGLGRSVKA
jgi:integrase/recombinase XerD